MYLRVNLPQYIVECQTGWCETHNRPTGTFSIEKKLGQRIKVLYMDQFDHILKDIEKQLPILRTQYLEEMNRTEQDWNFKRIGNTSRFYTDQTRDLLCLKDYIEQVKKGNLEWAYSH